jgi:hypothetical protein
VWVCVCVSESSDCCWLSVFILSLSLCLYGKSRKIREGVIINNVCINNKKKQKKNKKNRAIGVGTELKDFKLFFSLISRFCKIIWSKVKIGWLFCKTIFVQVETFFGKAKKLYSCFYKINLVNMQIHIRAGEKMLVYLPLTWLLPISLFLLYHFHFCIKYTIHHYSLSVFFDSATFLVASVRSSWYSLFRITNSCLPSYFIW